LRSTTIVGAKDSEILFICGIEISDTVRVDDRTERITKIYPLS
jgi:hypothetical protein